MAKMRIILGCDTSGFPLKAKVLKALEDDGYDVTDVGCYTTNDGYYLDAVEPVCKGLQSGNYDRGILFCGTGQGMNISANKFTGIRSAICYDIFTAKMSRADCNANVLCTGAWIVKPDNGIQMVKTWLMSDYYDTNVYGIEKMSQFEKVMKS